jgi:regulatory protein
MYKVVMYAAIKFLARREQAALELRGKLENNFPDLEKVISEVIFKLIDKNWQSDLRYAEMIIRSSINRYRGPLRIENELRLMGVNESIIKNAMESEGVDWSNLIISLSNKKYGSKSEPKGIREMAKRKRFYQSKGFSFEHVSLVITDEMYKTSTT